MVELLPPVIQGHDLVSIEHEQGVDFPAAQVFAYAEVRQDRGCVGMTGGRRWGGGTWAVLA